MTRHPDPWIRAGSLLALAAIWCGVWSPSLSRAEEFPFNSEEFGWTRNVPIPDFQNKHDPNHTYDFDAPPKGIFHSIVLAKDFEEQMGLRRAHVIVPVAPTSVFYPDSPAVVIVFELHQHYEGFPVHGLCFPEQVPGLDADTVIARDAIRMTLEDDSGYLKLWAPKGGWQPGTYKVEIHIGEEVNEISLMGTMRFTVREGSATPPPVSNTALGTGLHPVQVEGGPKQNEKPESP